MRKPMIIAERDLAGATPESLARALLSPLRSAATCGIKREPQDVVV